MLMQMGSAQMRQSRKRKTPIRDEPGGARRADISQDRQQTKKPTANIVRLILPDRETPQPVSDARHAQATDRLVELGADVVATLLDELGERFGAPNLVRQRAIDFAYLAPSAIRKIHGGTLPPSPKQTSR